MKNIELIEYLNMFPDDADVSLLLANPKERKIYRHTGIQGITDIDEPVLVAEITETLDMDEAMVKACEEDERNNGKDKMA